MWRNYGFTSAFYNILWWVCFYIRPPYCNKISTFAINKKTQWLNKKIILGLIYLDSKYYVVKLDYNSLIEEIKSQKLIFDLVKAFPVTVQNTVSPTPKQIYRKVNFLPSKSAQQINRIKSKNPGSRY